MTHQRTHHFEHIQSEQAKHIEQMITCILSLHLICCSLNLVDLPFKQHVLGQMF